jgi:hypothetical protein
MLVGALLVVAVCALAIVVLRQWPGSGTATVRLENRSDQTVVNGYIAVCEQRQPLSGVKPGTTVEMNFDVPRDCHYSVRLEMESGPVREASLGYVTFGLAFQDRIVVTRDGVILGEKREIESLQR